MKVLHTSDLHLGMTWRSASRLADQERVLAEILALCNERDVDLLLVAGDVFADRVEGNHAQVARRFLERLRPHLQRGRAVFLLRGNHDPLDFFRLLRLLLTEVGGHEGWPLVVADLPGIYHIPGHHLQVVGLPYLSPSLLQTQALAFEVTPEQQVAGLAGHLAHLVEGLYRQAAPDVPAIFAGHILISGAQIKEDLEAERAYDRELWLEPGRLPQFTNYNALGHIHLQQLVSGTGKPTWYSGAPERLNLGERDYSPHVLLVTTPEGPGGIAIVEPIALASCTPFVVERLNGAAEVERFSAGIVQRDPLGEVTIAEVPTVQRAQVEEQIRRVAPRIEVRWAPELAAMPVEGDAFDPTDVAGTVRAYLDMAFPEDSARRQRLLAAFDDLWSEASEVSA